MKVVIQNRETLKYLSVDQTWTKNYEEAMQFEKSLQAFDHCRKENLSNMQVVLKFHDDRYDLRLRVAD